MQKYVSQVTFYDYPLTSRQKINRKKGGKDPFSD